MDEVGRGPLAPPPFFLCLCLSLSLQAVFAHLFSHLLAWLNLFVLTERTVEFIFFHRNLPSPSLLERLHPQGRDPAVSLPIPHQPRNLIFFSLSLSLSSHHLSLLSVWYHFPAEPSRLKLESWVTTSRSAAFFSGRHCPAPSEGVAACRLLWHNPPLQFLDFASLYHSLSAGVRRRRQLFHHLISLLSIHTLLLVSTLADPRHHAQTRPPSPLPTIVLHTCGGWCTLSLRNPRHTSTRSTAGEPHEPLAHHARAILGQPLLRGR